MLCIHCEGETKSQICEHCGEDPLVDGRYRILEKLGAGANGTTYRAERLSDDKIVALKELLVRHAQSFKALELFAREATTLRQLDHPNIPAYYDDFTVEHGPNVGMYLAQEYVRGRSLNAALNEEMPLDRVLAIGRRVASVLDYLHNLSPAVVHRDIKPGNLIERSDGRIAVIDFGSVQEALGGDSGDGIPTMAGTMGYMPPEQLRGEATPASDVFALGMTMIALLHGRAPTDTTSVQDWTIGMPAEVRRTLKSVIAIKPANRPTAAVLVRELDAVLATLAEQSKRSSKLQALEVYASETRAIPANFEWGSSSGRQVAGVVGFGGGLATLYCALMISIHIGFGAVAVLVGFATIGGVRLMLRRHDAEQKRMELFQRGNASMGRVVGVGTDPHELGSLLYYEFEAGGVRRQGSASVPVVINASPGDDVYVHWDADNPEFHLPLPAFYSDGRCTP